MAKDDALKGKRRQHRGKFTEGLLDNDLILKALNINPGQTIIDAGCGNGYMAKLLSNETTLSGKVYALDPDKYFIKILKNETQETNIEAIEGDIARPTHLKESSVDLIYKSTMTLFDSSVAVVARDMNFFAGNNARKQIGFLGPLHQSYMTIGYFKCQNENHDYI